MEVVELLKAAVTTAGIGGILGAEVSFISDKSTFKTTELILDNNEQSNEKKQKLICRLCCAKDPNKASAQKYNYRGIPDCAALVMLHWGSFDCTFACAGMGNCAKACPVQAITMKESRPVINSEICTGCGACAKICPMDVLKLGAHPGKVQVYCRNTDPPESRRKLCQSPCTGCGLCVQNCPHDAIKLEDSLALVEHNKCPADCVMPCVRECPTGAIQAYES